MKIRGIILAGGSSRRMGENKLQLEWKGKSLIQQVIENAKESNLEELVLVYGKYEVETDVRKVYNENYELGMSTSIIKGLEGYNGDGVMLILGDMPFIDNKTIDRLICGFVKSTKNIVIPVFNGRRGNPVILGKKYFEDLMTNTGDKGAREIILKNKEDVEWIEVEHEGILIDIDEKSVYENYYSNFGL